MEAAPDLDGVLRELGLTDLERIGGGGFAEVYRARQTHLKRSAAVKVFTIPLLDDASRDQFESECEALRLLDGESHILRVYSAGVLRDNRPYLVTELCVNTVAGLARQHGGRLPAGVAVGFGVDLARALLAVHAVGLLHGDVTPQNVLLRGGGEVVLADFGMAVRARRVGSAVRGFNPAHAAPECMGLGVVDSRADVYGLGSTLATVLAGRLSPAVRLGGHADRVAHLHRELGDRGPSWPRRDELIETISAMLAEDPADRPSLVRVADLLRECAGDLRHAVDSAPARAVEPVAPAPAGHADDVLTTVPEPVAAARPRRWRAVGAGLVVAAGLGVAVVAWSGTTGSGGTPMTPAEAAVPAGPQPAGPQPAGPQSGAPPSSGPPTASAVPQVLRTGVVTDLVGTDGLDLDTGQVMDQNVLGMDLSPSRTARQLDGMSNGEADFVVLPDTGAEEYDRCGDLPDEAWADTVPDVDELAAGRQICVLTDERRLAMLTIERPPTSRSPSIDLHYVTWG